MKKFLYFILIVLTSGCIDLSIDDNSNEVIPNYSTTIQTKEISQFTSSNLISLNDNEFITALHRPEDNIEVVKLEQSFDGNNWILTENSLFTKVNRKLNFFNRIPEGYLLGSTKLNGELEFTVLNNSFEVMDDIGTVESTLDTLYNDVDSLKLSRFDIGKSIPDLLFAGKVYSQGTSYSCVLKTDVDLNVIFFKTYFESSVITDVSFLNRDSFLMLNNSMDGTDLILDNSDGTSYHKFDLNSKNLLMGNQIFVEDNQIYVSGIYNQIGRLVEVDLNTESIYINDLEIYPIENLRDRYLNSRPLKSI